MQPLSEIEERHDQFVNDVTISGIVRIDREIAIHINAAEFGENSQKSESFF